MINDFLMAIFFLSAGLEIKREIRVGELSTRDKAMLPIIGACGGPSGKGCNNKLLLHGCIPSIDKSGRIRGGESRNIKLYSIYGN